MGVWIHKWIEFRKLEAVSSKRGLILRNLCSKNLVSEGDVEEQEINKFLVWWIWIVFYERNFSLFPLQPLFQERFPENSKSGSYGCCCCSMIIIIRCHYLCWMPRERRIESVYFFLLFSEFIFPHWVGAFLGLKPSFYSMWPPRFRISVCV